MRPLLNAPGYFADEAGFVWSTHASRLNSTGIHKMSVWTDPRGYGNVTLRIGGRLKRVALHRVVAESFHGRVPDGLVVAHRDGDKSNNRPDNLVYVTQQQNIAHKYDHGTMIEGDDHPFARISENECKQILAEFASGKARKTIAADHGVSLSHIYALKSGRIRKRLTHQNLGAVAPLQ